MTGFIYVITNTVNGKQYVGQTTLSVERRWTEHCRRSRKQSRECSAPYPAIRSYGVVSFVVEAHAIVVGTQADLDAAERAAIATVGTLVPRGYNLSAGGFGVGPLHPDTKAKLRAFNLGKRLTPEHRSKMSASHAGHIVSAETRTKLSATHKGRHRSGLARAKMRAARSDRQMVVSVETRAKLSAAMKGRVFTPEWRAKISAAKKGKAPRTGFKHSQKTIEKIRASNKLTKSLNPPARRNHTAESKAKMSAAVKASWE